MASILGEPRIGLKPLAQLCRRLATSLGAGVDVRTVWLREAANAQGAGRRRMTIVSDEVATGTTITDSLRQTGTYFPDMFRELVNVGEQSGHLPEVFRQLAEHYDHQLKLRRSFTASLTWPLIELALAVCVIGGLIYAMGAIPQLRNNNIDILGFGLVGSSGLMVYFGFIAAVVVALLAVYRATARGVLWAAPLQKFVMRIPRLGRALETLAMSRLAWAMHVTLKSGMDIRQAMEMSLRSTHNVLYTQHIPHVSQAIRGGREVYETLAETRAFPIDFLDAVQVGEESGQLVESMEHLAGHYQDEARLAMNTLTILMGLAVTALIAGIIIFLIFRVFGFYVDTLTDPFRGK